MPILDEIPFNGCLMPKLEIQVKAPRFFHEGITVWCVLHSLI